MQNKRFVSLFLSITTMLCTQTAVCMKEKKQEKIVRKIIENKHKWPAHAWFKKDNRLTIVQYNDPLYSPQKENCSTISLATFAIRPKTSFYIYWQSLQNAYPYSEVDNKEDIFWLDKKIFLKKGPFKCIDFTISKNENLPKIIMHQNFTYENDSISITAMKNGSFIQAFTENKTRKIRMDTLPNVNNITCIKHHNNCYLIVAQNNKIFRIKVPAKVIEKEKIGEHSNIITQSIKTSKESSLGSFIASISQEGIKIWDPINKALVWPIDIPNAQNARFTRDGQHIISYHEEPRTIGKEVFAHLCIWNIILKKSAGVVNFKKCTNSHPKLDISPNNKYALLFDDHKGFLITLPAFK